MEKVYKHKKTGQIAYYKNGVFKQNNCSVEIGVEPSSEFWEQITKFRLISNPNGIWNYTETDIWEIGKIIDLKDKVKDKTFEYYYQGQERYFEPVLKKEPIFTTFDGVSIFEGDTHYYIWLEEPTLGQEVYKIYKKVTKSIHGDKRWLKDMVTFSSKESAEKYLKENQKQFSISDVVNFVNNIPEGRISADDVINFFNLFR